MASRSCSGESTSDLFSEIDPAYVSLVHSSLRTLTRVCFAFVKVVHASWDESFGSLPGASSKRFLHSTFPHFLRKVKNLAQVADGKLLAELPNKPPPSATVKESKTKKISEKFNCSFATFVELLATFIDSMFVALDCNLLTPEALSDLSRLDNAEFHIIAYCLYASRMWSNLPVQYVECFNRSCLEVARLLKSALDSPTMAALRSIKVQRRGSTSASTVPSPPSPIVVLARQFVDMFTVLVSMVIELKSKQAHLLKLGKLRENYLTVEPNYGVQSGEVDPCQNVCQLQGRGGNTTFVNSSAQTWRKGSLPTPLLRTIGLFDNEIREVENENSDKKTPSNKESLSSSSSSCSTTHNTPTGAEVVDTAVRLRRMSAVDTVDTISENESVFVPPKKEVKRMNTNNSENRTEFDEEIKRLHAELMTETDARMHFEQAARALDQHLTVSEAQLAVCRAELAAESSKRENLEKDMAVFNQLLKEHLQSCFTDGVKDPSPAGITMTDLKGKVEQLCTWNETACRTNDLHPELLTPDSRNESVKDHQGIAREEQERSFEPHIEALQPVTITLPSLFTSSKAHEVESPDVRRRDVGVQVTVDTSSSKNAGRAGKSASGTSSGRRSGCCSSQRCYERYRAVMCCPFDEQCPSTQHGSFVCVPVNVRYHARHCNCPVCQQKRGDNSRHSRDFGNKHHSTDN